jgi:hypothetical protein
MQIDTEHLHHWMQAIRQSNNPMRTMDAFWSGQLKSKEWLINCLSQHVSHKVSIDIHGGWVGVLASMLFQSNIPCSSIRSIDIDPLCEHIANTMNQLEYNKGIFKAVTADMTCVRSDAQVVINTSAEHLTQDQYDLWLSGLPHNVLVVVQGNNYDIPEHVRISKNIIDFKEQCQLDVKFIGELELPIYKRYMIIGKKHGYNSTYTS